MFSQASVNHSVHGGWYISSGEHDVSLVRGGYVRGEYSRSHGIPPTGTDTYWAVRILLEYFLVTIILLPRISRNNTWKSVRITLAAIAKYVEKVLTMILIWENVTLWHNKLKYYSTFLTFECKITSNKVGGGAICFYFLFLLIRI